MSHSTPSKGDSKLVRVALVQSMQEDIQDDCQVWAFAKVTVLKSVKYTVETRYNEIAYCELCFITNRFVTPSQVPIQNYRTSAAYNKIAYIEFLCIYSTGKVLTLGTVSVEFFQLFIANRVSDMSGIKGSCKR